MNPKGSATMSPTPPASAEPLDPIVEETIQRAMRPYLGVLPPAALRTMRDALVDALTTHPVAVEATAALRAQAEADGSGTRVRDGARDGEGSGETGAA
jgi:hypothetical protein